jgi:hypothetical protein
MDESERYTLSEAEGQAQLTAIFKELARALTLVRELTRTLRVESAARKLTELDTRSTSGASARKAKGQ